VIDPPSAVDTHHHLWDPTVRQYPWMTEAVDPIRRRFTMDDLRPRLVAHGVSQTVVVQAVHDVDETLELLGLTVSDPHLAGVVGWVDLTVLDVSEALAALRAAEGGAALVGIRHQVHDEDDPDWLGRADVRRGLAAVAEAGLVYDLLVRTRELPAARATAAAMPGLTFVVDHLAKPPLTSDGLQVWARELAAIAALDNVTAKISGLVTEADWRRWTPEQLAGPIRHALDCFGPHRLLFGSDWPVCLLAASYDEVVSAAGTGLAALDDAERAAVLGGNARRVYALPG
jgi:L-fuconolactonase